MRGTIALFVVASLTASAQESDPVILRARAVIDTLTSPGMHGRGYVMGGDSIAAAYIAEQFETIGLSPVKGSYFEPFTFPVNSFPFPLEVAVDGKVLVPGEGYLVAPNSGSDSGTFDLVHLTLADLITPERRAMTMGVVTGKASAIELREDTPADTLRLVAELERELAYYGPVLHRAQGKLTWGVANDALPHSMVEIAADQWNDSATTVTLSMRNELHRRHRARNVLGLAKGRSSKRTLIISAHYDHLGRMGPDTYFPGANDNASGISMLLNLAEHFVKNKAPYDVLFIAFAGEEAGLQGSEWCAVDRPVPLGDIRMMINLDLVGTGDEGITVVNATAQKKVFDTLVAMNAKNGRLVQVKERGPACNSDHCPFVKRGVPAVFIYTMGGIAAYHDIHDKAETLPLTDYKDLYLTLVDLIGTLK